jgi:excinuclease ABC subunit A
LQDYIDIKGAKEHNLKTLFKEMGKSNKGHTLFLLDEPTSGLHRLDIDQLLKLLRKLIALNNSMFVVEHALEVISRSDYIIDIGHEGGPFGGRVVAQGTPQQIAENRNSLTGKYLKEFIKEKIK